MVDSPAAADVHAGPQVSCIVPVYNAARYLHRCLDSLLDQQVLALEVICVDDASTDDSRQILEKYRAADQRVAVYFHRENLGAAAARNTALAAATGKYILFVDSDDALLPGAIEKLLTIAEENASEAVKGLMLTERIEGKHLPHKLNQQHTSVNKTLEETVDIQHLYQYTTYLFRTDTLTSNDLRFDTSLRNFQDPEFLSRLLPKLSRISVTDIPIYLRVVRPGSIISSDWGYDNYRSLVSGVQQVANNLQRHNQPCTLARQGVHFQLWWHKLERLPVALTEQESRTILQDMASFSDSVPADIFTFSLPKAGAYHALRLVAKGDLDQAYSRMLTASRRQEQYGRLVAKLADIATLVWSAARGRL